MTAPAAVDRLATALQTWHSHARHGDKGTDPALNDPAPYAVIRITADDSGRPGTVLAEITLTERHADDFASCLVSPTASATSAPWALADWLASNCGALPGTAVCWFVACDAAEVPEGSVPLNAASTEALTTSLDLHAVWLTGEQVLRNMLSIREGDRVVVVGTGDHLRGAVGRCGVVTRTKLVDPGPEPKWWYNVRLDGSLDFDQTFADGELELCPRTL